MCMLGVCACVYIFMQIYAWFVRQTDLEAVRLLVAQAPHFLLPVHQLVAVVVVVSQTGVSHGLDTHVYIRTCALVVPINISLAVHPLMSVSVFSGKIQHENLSSP